MANEKVYELVEGDVRLHFQEHDCHTFWQDIYKL
jgi:hypothetical protein